MIAVSLIVNFHSYRKKKYWYNIDMFEALKQQQNN